MTIHQYAADGNCQRVREELRNGVFVDARDIQDHTPLARAANSRRAQGDMLLLLIQSGADVNAIVDKLKHSIETLKSLNQFDETKFHLTEWRRSPLEFAASSGSLEKVQILLDAGADANLTLSQGYTAIFSAISALSTDASLIPMLELFVKHQAKLDCATDNHETPVTSAAEIGRFDAVRYLIQAGADPTPLRWTPLMSATALGSSQDVAAMLGQSSGVDEKDRFGRTALHLAAMAGDVQKAGLLLAQGCEIDATDQYGATALMIAAAKGQTEMLRWLIDQGADLEARGRMGNTALANSLSGGHQEAARCLIAAGADVESADDSGNTPLILAAQAGCADVVRRILAAGVDPSHKNTYDENAMSAATTAAVIRELVKAGEEINVISRDMKRTLTGMDGAETLNVSQAQYLSDRYPRFGRSNPEVMNVPFWREMVRTGINAYQAKKQFDDETYPNGPVWCFDRFGTSFTELPDGRFVQIAGEHEDYYDPDFCIYNDVFVHEPSGAFQIFGYPREVFPPTDFHTATYFNDFIYVIGGLGYHGERQFGTTPVYRLNCQTWKIERVETSGDNPGWIFNHKAQLTDDTTVRLSGGTICVEQDGDEEHVDNTEVFQLSLSTMKWCRSI